MSSSENNREFDRTERSEGANVTEPLTPTSPRADGADLPVSDAAQSDGAPGDAALAPTDASPSSAGVAASGMHDSSDDDPDPDRSLADSIGDWDIASLVPDDLFRRRGLVPGYWIGVPYLFLLGGAAAIACWSQYLERPSFVPFTALLYGCVLFFSNAYREAWLRAQYVRQFIAMLTVLLVLQGLALLHFDDASARFVYERGTRTLRRSRDIIFVAMGLNLAAALLLLTHGLGLGFGSRFFVRGSGERVRYNVVRRVLEIARERVQDFAHPDGDDERSQSDHVR